MPINSLIDRIFIKILQSKVYKVAKRTDLNKAEKTSQEFGNQIYMKREDQQDIHSFKIRGAFNAINNLSSEQKKIGVICASAGNHAQGVAKSAAMLGIEAHVVMPEITPTIKIDAVKSLGGIIYLSTDLAQAQEDCRRIAKEKKLTIIHPFDNEDVIAGQGTIGMEIFQDLENIDYVFVPVGGGGLISGIATYLKSLDKNIKVIGVEPENSNSMQQALIHKRPYKLKHVGTFADGVAVAQVGDIPFEICRDLLDGMVLVSVDKICSAMKRIYYEKRILVEPSGAVAMAGTLSYLEEHGLKNKNIVTVIGGANMNFDTLKFVAQNAKVGEGKEILLAVKIPERPGTLKQLCSHVIKNKHITEFNYRYHDPISAQIFIGVETNLVADREDIINNLKRFDFDVTDLTDDELSKNHIRSMIGGRKATLQNERVFSVVFPERRNALHDFLSEMEVSWSLTLFHYVNNGSSYSRIFMGINVPPDDDAKLDEFLLNLNYKFEEQTKNESYQIFLA